MTTIILGISTILQFIAAFLSVHLIKITGIKSPWILIALALTLMGLRRSFTLYQSIITGTHPSDVNAELIALTISVIMVLGVLLIRPIFINIRETTKALQLDEERLRYALDASSDGVWDWNVKTGEVIYSPKWCLSLGYDPKEVGNNINFWEKMIHPDDKESTQKKIHDHFERKNELYINEYRIRNKSGEYRYSLDRGRVIEWDKNGKPLRMIGTDTDITNRKLAEETIEKSRQHLKAILDSSAAAIFTMVPCDEPDKPFRLNYFSENIEAMTGYAASMWIADESLWVNHLHPDDRQRILANQEIILNEGILTHEYRFRCSDGSYIWVHDKLTAQRDDAGEIVEVIGTWIDITERKLAEERIKRFSRIFEDSINEIYLFEIDTLKFVQVNSAAQKNLGYTMEELKELTPVDIKPEFTTESFLETLMPVRNGEKDMLIFETVHKRKNASLYNVEVHFQLLQFESEQLFVAIILDITERKVSTKLLTYQASHDSLTGLINRHEFERRAV